MIYIDTSSLMKLILPDEYSPEVDRAIAVEKAVVVSTLGELEACAQIRAKRMGGKLSPNAALKVQNKLDQLLKTNPFMRKTLAGSVFRTALVQHERSATHCRTLDRLHLAAMEELGIERLMTHDLRQAQAARELGHEVLSPGM